MNKYIIEVSIAALLIALAAIVVYITLQQPDHIRQGTERLTAEQVVDLEGPSDMNR